MTTDSNIIIFEALSETEQALRQQLEARIEAHLDSIFQDLMEIQRHQLWRSTHPSFAKYCQDRWSFGSSRGYQIASAGQVMSLLLNSGETIIPANERQARELVSSGLEPSDQAILWKLVRETAPEGKISAAHVKSVVTYVKEMIVTGGAMDDGSGEQGKIADVVKAGITEETHERWQRQLQHLNGKGKGGRTLNYLETREVRSDEDRYLMFRVGRADADYVVKVFEEPE